MGWGHSDHIAWDYFMRLCSQVVYMDTGNIM